MPDLLTSADYLNQSSLLLQAYPETTRITTKYTFPSTHAPHNTSSSTKPDQTQSQSTSSGTASGASVPIATLILKTYNPEAGICLKYSTNKAQEVGRLITALGILAAGGDVKSLDSLGATANVTGVDVEMEDAVTTTAAASTTQGAGAGAGSGKGKSKKKGAKGKK